MTDGQLPELANGNAGQVPIEFLLERYNGFFVRGGQPRGHFQHQP